MAVFVSALWRSWRRALVLGLLLSLWRVGFAFADDCSGPSDCAGTTWFDNALSNGLIGTLLAGLGLTPIINLLFPGIKIPGMPGQPVTPRPPLAPTSPVDVKSRLDRLDRFARGSKNPELAGIMDKYRGSLVGPDGRVRQDQWDRFRRETAAAIDKWSQSGEKPNSWVWDAGASLVGATGEFVVQVGGVIKDAAIGIKDAAIWIGTKELEIGDALLHPVDTYHSFVDKGTSLMTSAGQWMDEHIGRELAREFNDALEEGRYWDALKAFGRAEGTLLVEVGKSVGGVVVAIGHEMLPIEEIKSFFDPNSDLETRLWAFPAAVIKVASLLTFSERLATTPVPGLGRATTLIPSVEKAALQAAQAEKLAALARVEGAAGNTARAAQQVEGLMGKALAESGPITNYRQLQNLISKNPELKQAIDEAIRVGGDGSSLYKMASTNTLSKEAHMLITARKMELQEQAMMSATRRILQEEAAAIQQAGGKVPGSYQTFNATQGSRVNLNGANVKADLDHTLLGVKNVSPERAREILAEEVRNLGMDIKNLDTNVYVPKRGLADVTGDKPFSEDALRRILNQNTSESGRYHVTVGRDGQIHVTGPFKGQGADVLGPGAVTHDPGLRVRPSTPIESLSPQQITDRVQQINSIDKYAHAGEWDRVVKSANRASDLGAFDQQTRNLIRRLASEKRPAELTQVLNQSGFRSWSDFVNHLNGFGA